MKTVIITDTNSWKFTGKKGGFYGNYKFCGTIKKIADFINEKNLEDYIDICLVEHVYIEQKKQIRNELHKDLLAVQRLDKYKILKHTMSIEDALSEWENSFDKSLKKFLKIKKNVHFIKYKKSDSKNILEGLILRYKMQKAPFKNKSSFMDSLIWEIIKTKNKFDKYTNIIILTNDAGFRDCQKELEDETGKNCYILTDETRTINYLENTYYNEVKYADIYKFVNSEYFDNMVLNAVVENFQELYPKEEIISFSGIEWKQSIEVDESLDEEDVYFSISEKMFLETVSGNSYKCDIFIEMAQNREILSLVIDNITKTS